jgi:hypothetical protein
LNLTSKALRQSDDGEVQRVAVALSSIRLGLTKKKRVPQRTERILSRLLLLQGAIGSLENN